MTITRHGITEAANGLPVISRAVCAVTRFTCAA